MAKTSDHLSLACAFRPTAASTVTIRDQVILESAVAHCQDRELQKKFFLKPNLTLVQALEIAKQDEDVRAQIDGLSRRLSAVALSEPLSVHAVTDAPGGRRGRVQTEPENRPRRQFQPRRPSFSQARSSNRSSAGGSRPGNQESCHRCLSRRHSGGDCPFKKAECYRCHRIGHTQSACKSPRRDFNLLMTEEPPPTIDAVPEPAADPSQRQPYQLNNVSDRSAAVVVNMDINGVTVPMQVDTGSSRSIISKKMHSKLWAAKPLKLKPADRPMLTYTQDEVPVVGVAAVRVSYKGQTATLPLVVADTEGPPLLGREWLQQIRLDWKTLFDPVQVVTEDAPSDRAVLEEALKKDRLEFCDLFKPGLGRYNVRKVEIEVSPEARPIFLKHRPPPFALRDQIERELDKQVEEGILEPVKTSQWAASVVPVKKASGGLRLCGSYDLTINKASLLERYPLPKVEELFAALSGGKFFTKIDLRDAYLQLEMNEASKEALTINTHKGLFRPNRLSMGVKSAVAIFQREMETLLAGIPNVAVFLDDIAITGHSTAQHRQNVREVLKRLNAAGLRVNEQKSVWVSDQVYYLGFCISAAGVHTSPEKTRAVNGAPQPQNVSQLRAYLGLLQYYSRFIRNLAAVAAPLYALERKGAEWRWESPQQKAFERTKELLMSAPVLEHFDPAKQLVLTVDASPYGLGAVLSHPEPGGDRPIAFASRTLSAAEKNYIQLDKEACAVLFGVTKFHQFVYGRPFVIKTDHKPLLGLLSPDKALPQSVSPRLLRWRLQLGGYHYQLRYEAGKNIGNADGLSRLPLPESPSEVCVPADVTNMLEEVAQVVEIRHVQTSTRRDPVLSQVARFLQTEWPEKAPAAENLLPFFRRRHELSLQDGCITWGCRIVIPPQLQDQVLAMLHDGHPGINQMKRLARNHFWWPLMDAAIESCVRCCTRCQASRASQPEAPPQPWTFPRRPWSRVHVDFAELEGRQLLIVVCAYSKWCDVFVCNSTSSATAIEKLRESFSSKGLPAVLVSDRGTAFTSAEFKQFMRSNKILHKFSPPLHPASNGQAEALVKVVKAGVARRSEGTLMTRISRFLFRYRNTPHSSTGRSPAELMLRRPMRCHLDQLHPDLSREIERKQSKWPEKRGRASDQLQAQDEVWVSAIPQSKHRWVPAIVTENYGHSCQVQLTDGRRFERHQSHIRRRTDRVSEQNEDLPAASTSVTDGCLSPSSPSSSPRATLSQERPRLMCPPSPLVSDRRYPRRKRHGPDRLKL